jgi:hypothetical protein
MLRCVDDAFGFYYEPSTSDPKLFDRQFLLSQGSEERRERERERETEKPQKT